MPNDLSPSETIERLEFRYDYSPEDVNEFVLYSSTISMGEQSAKPPGWTLGSAVSVLVLLGIVFVVAFSRQMFGERVHEAIQTGFRS